MIICRHIIVAKWQEKFKLKLNYMRTVLVGLAFFTINAVWQLYNTEIPIMLTKMIGDILVEAGKATWIPDASGSLTLDTAFPIVTVVNTIMSIDNVLAVFLLPFLGKLSDKTKTRFGKRTPYIFVGVIGTAVALPFVPLFYANNSIIGVAIMLGIILLAMSIYRSPAVALMPDVTEKPLRSKANAIINLMGAAGNVIIVGATAVAGAIFISGTPFYTALFITTAVVIIVALIVFMLTVKENELVAQMPADDDDDEDEEMNQGKGIRMQSDKLRSLIFLLLAVALWYMAYGAIETNFSRYAIDILKMSDATKAIPMLVAMGAAVVCFVPLGAASNKFGRKNVVVAGVIVLFVCAVLSSFITNIVALYIFFALIGISWAGINVNSYPMVVEMAKGSDIGKYTGYYYTFQMAAQIITPILSAILIDTLMKGSMRILFPYAAAFLFLALLSMLFVKHGDVKKQ